MRSMLCRVSCDESDAGTVCSRRKAATPRPASTISVIRKADRPCENESPMNAAIPERRPATEEISGLIERVTFHNDESGFCVLRVKARGQRDETTVIGSLPSVTAGEWLSAAGGWVRDKEHGLQFKASTMKTVPPTTAEGIERYLGSGLVIRKRPLRHLAGRTDVRAQNFSAP